MPHYRLYLLNSEGRVHRAVDIEYNDDEQAVAAVADHPHPHALELWQGTRRVAELPANKRQ